MCSQIIDVQEERAHESNFYTASLSLLTWQCLRFVIIYMFPLLCQKWRDIAREVL
jgi:hypothetical protein